MRYKLLLTRIVRFWLASDHLAGVAEEQGCGERFGQGVDPLAMVLGEEPSLHGRRNHVRQSWRLIIGSARII